MRFDVLTLFPEIFAGYLGQSLLKKAIDRGLVGVQTHDIRNWSRDKHKKVDDRPYGGGPGMVLKVEPIVECVEAITTASGPPVAGSPANGETAAEPETQRPARVVLLTPQGRKLSQPVVEALATEQRLVLICGRYEGFDQRVIEILQPDEISVGDYVLNGGEVAAMVVIDAVIRLVPGVLGDAQSSVEDSFSSGNRLLEFAQYTRPQSYRGHGVPEVLLSGDHAEIERWRREQGYLRTRDRRADLLPDSNEGSVEGE